MKQTGYDMLYLSACAINQIKPNPDAVTHMNLEKLFQMCQYHSLTALVCTALESTGVYDKKFLEAKAKAIRKNMLLDAEREKICSFLEQNHIWYMPLKGVILKDMYPAIGMRQMSDNDILFDKKYQKQVFEYMKKNGYIAESFGKCHHDAYIKPPVYRFEMHTSLFSEYYYKPKIYHYYSNIKEKLVRDSGKTNAYYFKNEDFYLFMIAHTYKHYSNGGTGLRSLLDCFVYLKKKEKLMKWDYIFRQIDKLGLSEFEASSRSLSMKIFENPTCTTLSDSEKKILEYYLFSGAYGTMKNSLENRIKKFSSETGSQSIFRYIFHRIFPDIKSYQQYYPFFYQHRLLLPIGWIFRLTKGIFLRSNYIKRELQFLYENKIKTKT